MKKFSRNVSERKVIQHFTTYGVQGAPQGRNATLWPFIAEGLQSTRWRRCRISELRRPTSHREVLRKGRRGSVSGEGIGATSHQWREKYCHMENKHQFSVAKDLRCNIRFYKTEPDETGIGKVRSDSCAGMAMIYFDRNPGEQVCQASWKIV